MPVQYKALLRMPKKGDMANNPVGDCTGENCWLHRVLMEITTG
jgi:hypothetical protein